MGLKRVFFTFFIQLALSFAGISLVWILLIFWVADLGILMPANTVEQQVTQWIAEVNRSERISLDNFPEKASYALFDKDMALISSNMDEKSLNSALFLAASDEMVQMNASYTTVYKKLTAASQTIVIRYNLRASFRSPLLARICPDAELFFAILLLGLLLADIMWIIIRYARKLERQLTILQDAAAQIKDQNLDFEMKPTKIKEFNRVLDSLNILRTELKKSLLNKWSLEQLQRMQMSALAHDIKTPLTILKGNAELLEESELDSEQQEYVGYILDNTSQIQEYVTQIIDVSSQKIISYSSKEPCSLSEFLANIRNDFKNAGRNKNLLFQIEEGTGLPEIIYTNKEGLKRILWNILDNAVSYSPQNGKLTMSVLVKTENEDQNLLIFKVLDEGPGFSEEALKYAATELYRGDKSRADKEHFGMGLSIAKQIVSQLGGELEIANAPQKGALVEVRLDFFLPK